MTSICASGLRRKRDLGLDHCFTYGLNGFRLLAQVSPRIAGDVVQGNRNQEVVNVIAAQVGIAIGGDDFKDSFMQLEDGDVKCSATKIVDRDDAFFLPIETIRQGGRGRLVDQAKDFEAGHASRILGRLALGIIKVGRHGDDRLGHRRTKVALRVALELTQNVGGDFGRREFDIA